MRILIATGGASHSDVALRIGGFIAEATVGASVTLLTVIKNEAARVQGESILERASMLTPASVEVKTRLAMGRPAEQIIRVSRETNQDLIVLGERIHHGLAKHILAPTAERVLEQMPCPVLIARGQVRAPKRLLLCEGGRDPSLLQRLMVRLAPVLAAAETLTVLHVMSQMAAGPGVEGWELRADAEELIQQHTPEGALLEDDVARLEQLQIHLDAKVRHGLVVQEIVKEARSGDYDLVVIGAHRGERWERFLLDDLAQEIVDHSDRPVLVV